MKLKKILASLTAAALAVTTMAFAPVSAAKPVDFGSSDGLAWAQADLVSEESSEMAGVDLSAATSVKINAVAYDLNYGWNNGQFYADGSSWEQKSFGGNQGTFDVALDKVGAFSVTMDFGVKDDNTWAVGWGTQTATGAFAVASIDFLAGASKIGTWADNEWYGVTDSVFIMTDFGSSNGSVWAQADLVSEESSEMAGVDLSAATSVTINAVAYDLNYGWNNGQFYADGSSWEQKSFGGNQGTFDVALDKVGAFSVTMDFGIKDDNTWAVGWGTQTATGAFAVYSIDFFAGSEKVGTWTNNVWIGVDVSAKDLTFDPDEVTLTLGQEPVAVTLSVEPENTTDVVEWSVEDEDVATVELSDDGYTFLVTPVAVGETNLVAIANENVTATCTITVEAQTYPIIVGVNDEAYGTASADKTEAAEGETVKLKATPNTGYKFVEWQSDEVTVANNAFTMPAEAVTVTAVFAEKEADEFDIVIIENDGGSVVVEGGLTAAKAGDEINLIVTPDEGFELDSISVNGEIIDGTSFVMPAEDVTISATFKASTYNVDIIVSEGGDADVDKTTAQMGDTVNIINIKPDDGFVLDTIAIGTENNVAIRINEIDSTKYSFIMPACDVVVSVSFKEEGSAGINVEAPDGIEIGFTDDIEDILAAIFGEDYEDLIEQGCKLDVIMTVKGEDEVSDDDKALIKAALADGQQVGLILDITLIKTMNGVSEVVTEANSPISFSISVPDSIIADGRTYSVIRVHNDGAQNIGGTFNSETKAITVSSALFSTYAIVYEDEEIEEPVDPEPQPEPVKYYSITSDSHAVASAGTAKAGTVISVRVDFGYDAYAYCGSKLIMKLGDKDTFVMPAGNVRIVSQSNGYLAMIRNAAPNSYIFVYDSDMNHIKTNGSVKGIVGEGKVTVKLGEEYAGRTITLYKGRKSTKVKIAEMVLDENGNATFTVEGGKNYTAVVE
ncbi:MAG: Ig-like domain-containing protein [Huintestinicola sp.]|uniref:InlB B-repeat-containing protein n=1 Tax=Huintestinicola sp. TaxID=2981661 RepID=UPI003F0684E1